MRNGKIYRAIGDQVKLGPVVFLLVVIVLKLEALYPLFSRISDQIIPGAAGLVKMEPGMAVLSNR